MDMFNSSGEINASSYKDLLVNLAKYASVMDAQSPSGLSIAGQPLISEAEEADLIHQALYTNDGKLSLGQAMANPIRKNLDYMGIFRRALVVDEIPQGADPKYSRDIDVQAVVVSSNGSGPESRVFSETLTVPTWELFANPTVRMNEARRRRFNIIDRAIQKARQELAAQEDGNGFAAFATAAQIENQVQDVTDTGMLRRDLLNLKRQVDNWDLLTSKFFLNINEFNDILDWASSGTSTGDLDPVTHREIMQTGMYGKIWSADILVSKIVPRGTIFACADAEFVGVLPVRQAVEVYPCDEMKQMKLGWIVCEEIGICIANPRAVAMGTKS